VSFSSARDDAMPPLPGHPDTYTNQDTGRPHDTDMWSRQAMASRIHSAGSGEKAGVPSRTEITVPPSTKGKS